MQCEFDVSDAVDLPGQQILSIEVFEAEGKPKGVVICFPGGACNRGLFDLQLPADTSYSLAQRLTSAGYLVVTVDHLGVGHSTRPGSALDVTVNRVVAANASMVGQLKQKLTEGTLSARIAPLPNVRCFSLGHSMGGFLSVLQQHAYNSFDGMIAMGFSSCGMPDFLCDYGKTLIEDPSRAVEDSAELARQQFGGDAYLEFPAEATEPESKESSVDPKVFAALPATRCPLITAPGAATLVPGVALHASNAITVPVLLVAGDRDICDPVEEIRAEFTACKDLETQELPDTGHIHFIYASRELMYSRLESWLDAHSSSASS